MGLDITAYSRLRQIGTRTEECEDAEHFHPHRSGFNRIAGLEAEGCYETDGEQFEFRAGSYGGYNDWREQLCRMALGVPPSHVWGDPARFTGKPFVELIEFSDCEGTIGPEVAKKLLADFNSHRDKADLFASSINSVSGSWFLTKYDEWQKAFALAADGGAVDFH